MVGVIPVAVAANGTGHGLGRRPRLISCGPIDKPRKAARTCRLVFRLAIDSRVSSAAPGNCTHWTQSDRRSPRDLHPFPLIALSAGLRMHRVRPASHAQLLGEFLTHMYLKCWPYASLRIWLASSAGFARTDNTMGRSPANRHSNASRGIVGILRRSGGPNPAARRLQSTTRRALQNDLYELLEQARIAFKGRQWGRLSKLDR
jgi:hypothetical protein